MPSESTRARRLVPGVTPAHLHSAIRLLARLEGKLPGWWPCPFLLLVALPRQLQPGLCNKNWSIEILPPASECTVEALLPTALVNRGCLNRLMSHRHYRAASTLPVRVSPDLIRPVEHACHRCASGRHCYLLGCSLLCCSLSPPTLSPLLLQHLCLDVWRQSRDELRVDALKLIRWPLSRGPWRGLNRRTCACIR